MNILQTVIGKCHDASTSTKLNPTQLVLAQFCPNKECNDQTPISLVLNINTGKNVFLRFYDYVQKHTTETTFELKNSECKSDNDNDDRGVNDFETIN